MTLTADQLTPRGNRLLVRPLPQGRMTEKVGSLWLPPSGEDWQRYMQWEIVACGPEVRDETLLPGACVLCARFTGALTEIGGQSYAFIAEENIIAVLP